MKRFQNLIFFIVAIVSIGLTGCNSKTTKKETDSNPFAFNKNSRVVFVGNSITHAGMFHNNIFLYHVTRFPNKNIYMFNCGVSGDVTWGVLDRMEEDILVNKPTHAVIMLGMNDVGRSWYGEKPTTNTDTLKHRKDVLRVYRENMEKIVNVFLEKNIKVILERPSIYDQTAILPAKNNYGVNDALGICATYVDSLAAKYNLPTVDYFGIMNKINTEMQKKDSSFTLTGQDRIHPGETGHFVMSYQFLKSEKAPKYVSEIVINSTKKSADKNTSCEVKSISKVKDGITFTVMENSLPFPVTENQKEGLQLVSFMNEFNVELLQIQKLSPKSKYQLKIDNEIIGSFSGKQLDEGINLAEYKNTPQYKQSLKVLEVLQKLWVTEGKLRGMKFIEYLEPYKKIKNKDNFVEVEAFMDSAFTALGYTNPYYKSQLNKFLKNKPKEKEYKKECDLLIKKAYKIAQPVEHTFLIEADSTLDSL